MSPAPDHSPVDQALTVFYAAVSDELVRLSDQLDSQMDSCNSILASKEAEIAALKLQLAPFITKVVNLPDLDLKTKRMATMSNVTDKVQYLVTKQVSARKAEIDALVKNQTNNYSALGVGGGNASQVASGIDISNVELVGEDIGTLFNGMRVGYSQGAVLETVTISGIPGTSSTPPWETFGLNLWHANGLRGRGITIDGRRKSDGKPVAATLFGLNSCHDVILDACIARYAGIANASGIGLTMWDSYDVEVNDLLIEDSVRALNLENCRGSITYNRPILRRIKNSPHLTANSNTGSSKIVITDPVVDSFPFQVKVNTGADALYLGKPQLQKPEDIKLIINGVDVSSDKTKLSVTDY